MNSPKISVCLDVFNYATFLPRAIESVLKQTCEDFELIIADDCSTDGSFEIAQRYDDERIKLIRNPGNLGMVRNRNAALHAANGEYIKPLHADDFLSAGDALEKMAALLEHNPAISLAASAMLFVGEKGARTGEWCCFETGQRSGTGVITRCLREQRNLIGGPSAVMFRSDLAKRGFDESFFHMADLEMWFHLLEQGCFAFIAEPLCAYRKHSQQQTERDRATLSQADDYDALLARYLDRNYIALKPWIKRYLRRDAQMQRARRCHELGLPAKQPGLFVRSSMALAKLALRQKRSLDRLTSRPQKLSSDLPKGINVVGFFASQFGVGEASRGICRAVELSGLPHVLVNIRSKVHRNGDDTFTGFSKQNPFAVNLMTFSYDYARRFHRDMGRRFFAGRYNIALWYGELEKLSPRWHSAFDYYDEIWVTTEYCRKAIAAVSPIPVIKIPQPVLMDEARPDRSRFGISQSAFVFLFSFDYFSVFERKNPLGLIEAFRDAFRTRDDAILVIKSINAAGDSVGCERLHEAARGLNVLFLEEHMSGDELATLFASIDCYVSLHRAEGLGLGMAQAMSLGKPVIATNYSGNLEFMNESSSFLVNYKLIEIDRDYGPYEKGYVWAEPDISHAAELMRYLYENRDKAAQLGSRAAEDIRQRMSVEASAKRIRERIDQIIPTR